MKAFFTALPLVCAMQFCQAQYISVDSPRYKIVRQDTINIRGIVYDVFNNPVRGVYVVSQNKEKVFEGLPIYSITDKDGKFLINGALVRDTLELWWDKKIKVLNNGSRYLELHLPYVAKDTVKINIAVSAERKVAKKDTPVFRVLTNAVVMDYFGIPVTFGNAQYPGGPERLAKYVSGRVKYPQKAIDNNIEGEVDIGFSIEKDGTPVDFHVVKGIGYGCEEAVIDVLKTSPKWRPAITNGIPQTGHASVSIVFGLNDK